MIGLVGSLDDAIMVTRQLYDELASAEVLKILFSRRRVDKDAVVVSELLTLGVQHSPNRPASAAFAVHEGILEMSLDLLVRYVGSVSDPTRLLVATKELFSYVGKLALLDQPSRVIAARILQLRQAMEVVDGTSSIARHEVCIEISIIVHCMAVLNYGSKAFNRKESSFCHSCSTVLHCDGKRNNIYRCGGCLWATYCSKEDQARGWDEHSTSSYLQITRKH